MKSAYTAETLREQLAKVSMPDLNMPAPTKVHRATRAAGLRREFRQAGPAISAATARENFDRIGKPITEWARQHGFNRSLVYMVLSGGCKAKRGKGHQIAVLLGMKQGVAITRGARK